MSGNPVSGQITITVPTAALGTVGSGWTFAVALAGQDDFGTDDARAFTATLVTPASAPGRPRALRPGHVYP